MSILGRLQLFAVALTLITRTALGAEHIDLAPQYEADSLTHVTVQLDVGGHNIIRAGADDAKAPNPKPQAGKADEKQLPISVSAKLTYDERRLTAASETAASGTPLAARHYDTAEATIKVDQGGRAPKLADEHRLIVVAESRPRPTVFCPDALLSREELDLIDVVGDSLAADRLLPNKPVAEGESWTNDATVISALLTLDSVAVCEVQSVLDEFNSDYAKIRLAGTVHGMCDGAATQQEVRGVYLYDRRAHRVSRLNLAIREVRSIGDATPGLDAVAKVQISISPLHESAELSDAAIGKIKARAGTPDGGLSFESSSMGFRVKHDRQWYITGEGREAVTFRRVDGGDLAAQCTFTSLPAKSEGRQTSLEQFQKDIQYNLGKSFGELASSRQWQNAAGLYCYEVVARGFVEELPVEWHYYLAAPASGPRLSVVVTIEKPMVDRVASADRDLVESLQLFPATPAAKVAVRPGGSAK
jgi:hypothetical protein